MAHRGLALEAPENTVLAFEHAVAVGAQYIETDVHVSADGVCVIAHDPDLTRVAGRKVGVHQLTMPQLRAVDLGHGQGFCTLADALDAFPSTRFNIDVKVVGAISPAVETIKGLAATSRVLVTSFSDARRLSAIRQLPSVATSASARTFATALGAARAGATWAVTRALRGIDAVQIPERALGVRTATERMLRQFHDAGVEVHLWTINDPHRMRELLDLGVDGLVTDRADLALAEVRAYLGRTA